MTLGRNPEFDHKVCLCKVSLSTEHAVPQLFAKAMPPTVLCAAMAATYTFSIDENLLLSNNLWYKKLALLESGHVIYAVGRVEQMVDSQAQVTWLKVPILSAFGPAVLLRVFQPTR